MQMPRNYINWVWWAALALPAIAMAWAFIDGKTGVQGQRTTEYLLHPSGEIAAQLLIIALMISPLQQLFPKFWSLHWLRQRRRHIGVAAFGYALLHTLFYLLDMATLHAILGEFFAIGIWTGWLALAVMAPLAITSNNTLQRRLGRAWKPLQRFAYLAAFATLLHWVYVHNNLVTALLYFTPLILLQVARIYRNFISSFPSSSKSELE